MGGAATASASEKPPAFLIVTPARGSVVVAAWVSAPPRIQAVTRGWGIVGCASVGAAVSAARTAAVGESGFGGGEMAAPGGTLLIVAARALSSESRGASDVAAGATRIGALGAPKASAGTSAGAVGAPKAAAKSSAGAGAGVDAAGGFGVREVDGLERVGGGL